MTKPVTSPELKLPDSAGVRPVAGATHATHATAAQLAIALGLPDLDDAFLRNHHKDGIPKPVKSRYPINDTILALLKYYHARDAASTGDLPGQYANMQAMENALGTSKKAIKWLLKNGAGEAQDAANRIAPLPVLRRAFEVIALVADGHVTGIGALEQWNHQTELAKKLRLESEKLKDEEKLRKGQMMLARDGSFALTEMQVDELIWDMRDQPLRAALVKMPNEINRQHKNILAANAPAAANLAALLAEVTNGKFKEMLDKLRAKIPPQREISNHE